MSRVKQLSFGVVLWILGACSGPPLKSDISTSANTLAPSVHETTSQYAQIWGKSAGAIATVNPIATQAGIKAFKEGGNAIDAALAAAFTLGVVDSHNSGIGGGCFILVRLAAGEILAIDGREMAPAKATRNLYIKEGVYQAELSKTGALASGIPGSVAAYAALQKRGGKLNFADILLPAAAIAERGFTVDATMALRLARTKGEIEKFPATAEVFLKNSQPLSAGQLLVQKDLASSYRHLAKEGPAWFYTGGFAKKTAQWMATNGGIIDELDFANYQVVFRKPLMTQFRGYTLYGFPPPSSGGVHVAQILNVLEQFDLRGYTQAEVYHLIAEATRLAFADRAYWLGDSDFIDVPRGLASQEYALQLAKKISVNHAATDVTHNIPPLSSENLFDKHTTHIAAADAQGNWIAITTTLNTSFGSKVIIPGTGVLLNNQMDDFAAEPGVPNAFGLVGAEANAIAPRKRPLSSMSPTLILKDGTPVLTLGAAGGPTIISQVAQVLVRYLEFNDSLRDAVAFPRIHHQWRPDLLFVEPTVTDPIRHDLMQKGHIIKELGSFGSTQAISWDGSTFTAVTEPRVIARNNAAELSD